MLGSISALSVPAGAAEFPWPFRHKDPYVRELYIPFEALTAEQQRLLGTLRDVRSPGQDLKKFWEDLGSGRGGKEGAAHGNSVQRTFFCDTEALEQRKVKDGRKVIELVDAITDIAGSEKHKHSAEQFNIEVRWKKPPPGMKSIKDLFDEPSGYHGRFSTDHPGEDGIQEKSKGYVGVHLLFNDKDETRGHIHVDFRPTNWFEALMTKIHLKFLIPKELRKGHFNPNNADLGAIGPEKEHGRPIDNLEWFAKFYDDPRVLAFAKPIQHTLPDEPEVRSNPDKRLEGDPVEVAPFEDAAPETADPGT